MVDVKDFNYPTTLHQAIELGRELTVFEIYSAITGQLPESSRFVHEPIISRRQMPLVLKVIEKAGARLNDPIYLKPIKAIIDSYQIRDFEVFKGNLEEFLKWISQY